MNDQDIVLRLRQIVAEPETWCKTDQEYVEDAADTIERLIQERDEARRLYCERMSPADPPKHAEKWRWDCYGKFDEAQKLKWQLEEAIQERDSARRFACENTIHPLCMPLGMTARQYAELLGWDCFDTVDKDAKP